MKDEIKEIKKLIAIINCMKDSKLLDNGEYYKVHSDFIIYLEENKTQLLDYINNLQEENMKLISENEAIKNIKYTVDEMIYKSRNEKAVNILKDLKYIDKYKFTWDREFNKALNILQGSDKDE